MIDTDIYNSGVLNLSGEINLNSSKFENTGIFSISDDLLNLTETNAINSRVFYIKSVDITWYISK